MSIAVRISRLVYEFHRCSTKTLNTRDVYARPQDDASGEQVFATFTKLFLNATSIVRNSSYSKLLDSCPSFFFYFEAVLRPRYAAPIPRQFFSVFFSRSLRIKSGKRWQMTGAALYSVASNKASAQLPR